ncbi:MAG: biotin synthase, partial [Rubrivivax sp.]
GPGTLEALQAIHADAGWGPPQAPFVDMHDVGDMLVEAGFADPVMDQETLTLTWADGDAALAELRALGGNADPGRTRGLRTPRWRSALAARLPRARDQRVALDFEVVYGHAVRVAPRPRIEAQTTVRLQDMRSILRSRRAG